MQYMIEGTWLQVCHLFSLIPSNSFGCVHPHIKYIEFIDTQLTLLIILKTNGFIKQNAFIPIAILSDHT